MDELSLLDICLRLVRGKRTIIRTAFLFGAIGLVVAVVTKPEYSASMTVMSELGGSGSSSGGLGSTLRSFGFLLPSGPSGSLSAQAIPELVSSRPVRLAVARDTIYFPSLGFETTLSTYLQLQADANPGAIVRFIKSWTVGVPGRLLALANQREPASPAQELGSPTAEEEAAMEWVGTNVSTSRNQESGLITISASGPDPHVTAELVASVSRNLRSRVQEVYTDKTRQNLEFVERQFEAARSELQAADQSLASFRDRNQNLSSSRSQLEEQRLRREVTFKSQLFSELQAQLTQAQIDLQKSEPVITTIEPAAPPLRPSAPNRKLILIVSIILGIVVGSTITLLKTAFHNSLQDHETQAKLSEIRGAVRLIPGWMRRGGHP